MSEPMMPFALGEAEEDDAAARPDRRRALLALGGVGVVGLAVLGVLVLGGPDGDDLDLGLPTGTPAAAATPQPSASASPAAAPVTAQLRRGRDPFEAPAGAGTGPVGGGTAASPEDGGALPPAPGPAGDEVLPQLPVVELPPGTGTGPVPGTGTMPGAGPVPGTGPGPVEPTTQRRLALVRVSGDQTAVLSLDGTSETVRVGDGFGPDRSLLLLSVQQGPDEGQWTAVVQQGTGEPFDVVTGRPVTVA